ncbi:DUF4190 domain-containing protein [Paractinoplanes atraurantiacus]|nr:DUF4190 domain-containing protein [Actinoplanes atraurantiacus]
MSYDPSPPPYQGDGHPPVPPDAAPISPYPPPGTPGITGTYQPQVVYPAMGPVVVIGNPAPTSGYAVASMVLGIVGILGGWCTFAVPCVLAVVLGHAALHEMKRVRKEGRGMAIAGLVLGYVCLAPAALIFFWVFLAGALGVAGAA